MSQRSAALRFWCKKSQQRLKRGLDLLHPRCGYLWEAWDNQGRIFLCYQDHQGPCQYDVPAKPVPFLPGWR